MLWTPIPISFFTSVRMKHISGKFMILETVKKVLILRKSLLSRAQEAQAKQIKQKGKGNTFLYIDHDHQVL